MNEAGPVGERAQVSRAIPSWEVALCLVGIVIATFLVPFVGGTALAVILAVTRFRAGPRALRWSLLAVGVVAGVVVAVSIYGPSTTTLHIGPPVLVSHDA